MHSTYSGLALVFEAVQHQWRTVFVPWQPFHLPVNLLKAWYTQGYPSGILTSQGMALPTTG